MKTLKSPNGTTYYSTKTENGETIFSFSPNFEDIWDQETEDYENERRDHYTEPKWAGRSKQIAEIALAYHEAQACDAEGVSSDNQWRIYESLRDDLLEEIC